MVARQGNAIAVLTHRLGAVRLPEPQKERPPQRPVYGRRKRDLEWESGRLRQSFVLRERHEPWATERTKKPRRVLGALPALGMSRPQLLARFR